MSKRITDFFAKGEKRQKTNSDSTPPIPAASSKNHLKKTSTYNSESSTSEATGIRTDWAMTSTANSEPSTSGGSEGGWYKGNKLDVPWLLKTHTFLSKVKICDKSKRYGIKCTICFKQLEEAKKFSRNGTVPIADGIRYDGQKELERIIDHLSSASHEAARKLEALQVQWTQQSDSHPWVKVMKIHSAEKIKILVEIAVDVYNDSRQLTLSAWSWPSRSLSKIHADTQIAAYADKGMGSPFAEMSPNPSLLHYRNPIIYAEMLEIVGDCVMSKIKDEMHETICFSIQVDGSVDKYNIDNKFVTARYFRKSLELKTVFLGETKSEKRGAEGLLESITLCFRMHNLEDLAKEKLTGLTTDGESANTGKNTGLWVRLKNYLGRNILCIWCVAHRTDLVLSDLEVSVSEVKHWKQNLKAIATFYRASSVRFQELEKIGNNEGKKIYKFPEHFDVRFAEHLLNLTKAVWSNLSCIRKHWQQTIDDSDCTKNEKAQARGFLKVWERGKEAEKMTVLMMDLLRLIEKLQKEAQRSMITLPDIEITRGIVTASLDIMAKQPYPGGFEEKLLEDLGTAEEEETPSRRASNVYVSTNRCWSAIRNEIVLSTNAFLKKRLDNDQEKIIATINKFISISSASEMVKEMRGTVDALFGEPSVEAFTDETVALFASEKLPPPCELNNATAKLYHFLKVSEQGTIFSKLVQSFMVLTPHSSGPERAVSNHTTLKSKKQASLKRSTINSRMIIALNGSGTAFFDPRPAVVKFLELKSRRDKQPDAEVYQSQEFVKKFFANDSNL